MQRHYVEEMPKYKKIGVFVYVEVNDSLIGLQCRISLCQGKATAYLDRVFGLPNPNRTFKRIQINVRGLDTDGSSLTHWLVVHIKVCMARGGVSEASNTSIEI